MADSAASLAEFNAFRSRMNDIILGAGNLTINRFFRLDGQAYEAGRARREDEGDARVGVEPGAAVRRLHHLPRRALP
jgi:hypothetical protein